MQANWSLILNVLLLIGVIMAIGYIIMMRRQSRAAQRPNSNTPRAEKHFFNSPDYTDDIIAVRKISTEEAPKVSMDEGLANLTRIVPKSTSKPVVAENQPAPEPQKETIQTTTAEVNTNTPATLMFFLSAKEERQFAGYELLQTVLAAGLRFGEGNLFHKHQQANGQGLPLCSLATATATGVFDLQNIGVFQVRGLCLFMHVSKNNDVNAQRFAIMLETARQLSEGLNAYLLDDQRKPLTSERIAHYCQILQIEHDAVTQN